MEPYKENGAVNLRRIVVKQPATRIIAKSVNPHKIEGFSASRLGAPSISSNLRKSENGGGVRPVNLTDNNFSVTRARVHAHAYAHARANTRPRVSNDEGGLRRVLNAALNGGDVKVASIKPMSFSARLIAILLLPMMLIMPLLPAYANEAPLSERVAGDVAAILDTNTNSSLATLTPVTPDVEPTVPDIAPSVVESTISDIATSAEETSSIQNGEVAGVSDQTSSSTDSKNPEVAPGGSSDSSAPSATPSDAPDEVVIAPSVATTETSGDAKSENITPEIIPTETSSSTEDAIVSEPKPDETQVLDVPSLAVQESLDEVRAKLRNEVRNEVKMEVRKEVESEVYKGCKNLDGTGYYCIPDAKSFGSAVVANERSISVTVQPDELEGDKEIFLSRNNVALQLTHNADDDVFPVLDPSSDLLVWQSLVNGHWQIAYAHVNDVGVPKVNYLTSGENNFNPKVYRGRIVWQAWIDGNWEIFSAIKAPEKLPDDALTAEHRLAHIDGNWNVIRITANNTPDMFPSVTSDAVSWQAIDDGVWQVFSYDLVTGESHRVSKKGVKSESPRTAMIWSEEDSTGQVKLVGTDVSNTESIDFTEMARRLVDKSKDGPKSPITNTEIVVITPTVVRVEDEAVVAG